MPLPRGTPVAPRAHHGVPDRLPRQVLVHLALDDGRRRTRQRDELGHVDGRALDDHEDARAVRVLGRVESSADLTKALGELAPRQHVTLMLRYFDDLSEAQVAEVMGCSVGTVKSTTSRALQRLRAIVDPPDPPDPHATTTANASTEMPDNEGSIADEDGNRS